MALSAPRFLLVLLVATSPAAAQQETSAEGPAGEPVLGTATVSGRVLDVTTGSPIAGAVVYLPDIRRGSVTDETGGFVMEQMPVGDFKWRIQRLGYATWEADSPLQDGDWFTVRLLPRPEVIAGITVVADAFENRRRRVSTGVRVAERPQIMRAAARNGAEVLESVGNVDVVRCSGQSFAGSPTSRPSRQPLSFQGSMGGTSGARVNGAAELQEKNPTHMVTGAPGSPPGADENCLRVDGQMMQPAVYLDDEQSSVALLATLPPSEIQLVEVYGRGEWVYVYTQRYVEQLAREGRRPRPLARF
jgi:hypothetical protein